MKFSDNDPFGMFYKKEFHIGGLRWLTVEHAYQSKKYENIDMRFTNILRNINNPSDVRYLSNIYMGHDKVFDKKDALKHILSNKFSQNEELRRLLVETGCEPLEYIDSPFEEGLFEDVLSEVRQEMSSIPFNQLSLLE